MNESKNIHEGHRERMIRKFMANPKVVPEHELLEMLLYESIKRKDTNYLAHQLLNTFGNIEKVLSASPKELLSVKGIGNKTAQNLALYGAIFNKIVSLNRKPKKFGISVELNKTEFIDRFIGVYDETFIVVLLDKNYYELTTLSFSDFSKESVSGNIPDIANAIAINKPASMIIAHNHPSGNLTPSEQDDIATAKINLLCVSHGVSLLDHVIVVGKETYSYHESNRLEFIKTNYSLENTLKNGENKGVKLWTE